jgi:hypothetical protein
MDLSAAQTALLISYSPYTEPGGSYHFDANGHLLLAYLMAHGLIHDKVIPWK